MKANLATSLIAYARGGVRKQLLVLCLLTLCIGNMWGGTKRIYCEYSGVSSWWSTIYVYAWGGEHDAKKYTMTATGTSNLVYCDIDDYHTDLLFFKSNSQTGSWETQSVDVSISSNNRWSLGDGGWGNKGTISNQQRYAPGTAIDGLVDIKNPHNQMFTDGTYSTTLEAHKTYEFKILETSTLYGLNDLIATSSISNQTLNTSGYQVRLCTAGAGTYTFAYNSSTHTLSITYPETSHPSIDYCYVIDYSWSPSANLHLWNGTSTKVAEWNGGSTIAGSTWPGAAISNKTTIGGQSYFYIAPGEYANFLVSKSGHETDRSGDLTTSDGYGKRRYWKDETDGWIWDTFTVRIQLNDLTPTTRVDPTYMDVAFNSDVLSDLTAVPTKNYYDFGGFYTGYDELNEEVIGVQVINAAGEWIASVEGYTDAEKRWIHEGTSTTLYAKWTEHPYTINLVVSPEGVGTIDNGATIEAYYTTASADITATANIGYSFREWDFSKTGEDKDVYSAEGYTSLSNPIRIKARHDGTLTAKFTANNYNVNLENLDSDEKGTENVSVTYNSSANLTENITIPQKAYYDFGGYYTSSDEGVTLDVRLIDENGAWIASVDGYTDSDKNWLYADNLILYAKWTEHPYTIDLVVSPEGAGTIDKGTTIEAYYTTVSADITATASTGYSFREWDFSKTGEDNDVYSAEGYTSLSNPIRVLAQHDGTLTAKFTANNYNVNLENLDADEKGTENVSVTYNSSANLTENITIPQKEHYDFGGYYASSDEGTTLCVRLIDENGAWIASVDGYTDGDKNWLYTDNLILYAKWTEHPYTVDLKVSPEGAGTIDKGTTIEAYYVKPTDLITATPVNPAWKFKEWQYSENVGPADGTGNDNTVQIKATRNGTLTAVFEPRYCLVGQLNDGSNEAGGMPGWHDYTADFMVNSYTDLSTMNLTCVRSLDPNTTYKFEVHDKVNGKNLGYATPSTYIGDQSLLFNTQNNDVLLRVNGYGECTFTISALSDGDLYPTVSVAIPASHQLNLEWADVDIDNNWNKTSRGTGGSVSALTTESGHNFAIRNGEYVAHGGDITYTATPAPGYTFEGWYNTDYNTQFSTTNPYTSPNIQTTENVEAKFVEKATAVTLSNDGHGHVEIDGMTVSSTTVGVTTTRELTAVPNEGYIFSGWTLPENADFEIEADNVDNPTITLRGKGAGTAGEIIANFTECWVLSAESDGWGSAEFTIANIEVEDGKAIGYADIALPANTDLQFKVVDKSTSSAYKNGVDQVYYMTYGNSQDWSFGTDKTYNCGITTAGKGSYRFNWNFTDKTMTVVYPESYQVNYGAAVGGSVTSVLDDDGKEIPNGGYVREGGSVTYEATANEGYTFTGWCSDDSYGDIFTNHNPWENSNVTATSNAYAKFHSTNFVIYRTGDKSSDPRAVWDDVESYEGGTISETIEFRMKVNELDYWYTLCLPFEVNAVQVWDEVDGAYYDIVPYWRTEGTYYTGHYILRRPVTTTDFAIEGFEGRDRWVDPESNDVLPSKNIPYIIQWHDPYFRDMYISFLGAAGQEIPTAMDKGNYASSDETVNIYGNNSMTTGMVRDAYLLEPDYGPDGAWIREDIGTERSVLPFECFILANPTTTAKYRVLRRDMADDTPTGLDTLSLTEDSVSKVMINNRIYIIRGGKIYTIQGTFVKEVE